MAGIKDQQIEILKSKTMTERLQLAFNLFEFARRRIAAEIFRQQPQLNPREINRLVVERFVK